VDLLGLKCGDVLIVLYVNLRQFIVELYTLK